MFEKDMKISALIDIYGALLSARKREIMEYYYDDDLSLSEIAEETGISRQGVRDAIKKSESELAEFEEKLGLFRRISEFDDFRMNFASRLENVCTLNYDEAKCEIKTLAKEIRKKNL